MTDALVQPLLRIPLFQGLTAGQLKALARQAERQVFNPGEAIVRAGRAGNAAFIVVAGDAVRVAGPGLGEAPEAIEPGSLIGEMAMLIEHEYGSTVMARGQVRALRLTRVGLHELMLADPALTEHLVDKIAGRLTAVAAELRRIDGELAQAETFEHLRPATVVATMPLNFTTAAL